MGKEKKNQATNTISELWVIWSSRLQDTSKTLCGHREARSTLRQPSGPPVGPCICPAPPGNPGPPRSAPNVAVLKHMTVNICCKVTVFNMAMLTHMTVNICCKVTVFNMAMLTHMTVNICCKVTVFNMAVLTHMTVNICCKVTVFNMAVLTKAQVHLTLIVKSHKTMTAFKNDD